MGSVVFKCEKICVACFSKIMLFLFLVARSCLQVKSLLLIYPQLGSFLIFVVINSFMHACVLQQNKPLVILIHVVLGLCLILRSEFSNLACQETLQAKRNQQPKSHLSTTPFLWTVVWRVLLIGFVCNSSCGYCIALYLFFSLMHGIFYSYRR